MANRASGMPIATMSENKASSPEWLLQSVIEKLQHRVALRSLGDANLQPSAFPGFGVPTESAGATQKFHPADSIHDPHGCYWAHRKIQPVQCSAPGRIGRERPGASNRHARPASSCPWRPGRRSWELRSVQPWFPDFFFFYYYLFIYIYTIQIYTVHQFPPQVLIWIAHFTAFPMLSLQVPPALTPRATNAPPLTAELGTKSASMKLPFLRLFPCLPQFPMIFHVFFLFFLTILSTTVLFKPKKNRLDVPWS